MNRSMNHSVNRAMDSPVRLIDAHIHPDLYEPGERERMLEELGKTVEAIIAVSMHEASCKFNLLLSRQYPGRIYPAFGFHPEQVIPDDEPLSELMDWITRHRDEAIAIGEVGLPYYNRLESEERGMPFDLYPYIALLDRFIVLAAELDKPVILHAVYEDADIACDLLERHGVTAAHFHWFKGAEHTVQRMVRNRYYISITPDVLYEQEIRELVRNYPLELLMAETDGPWPFKGPFTGRTTLPDMARDVVMEIALLKGVSFADTSERLYGNTRRFYNMEV